MDLVRLASPWVLAGLLPVWAIIVYAVFAPRRRRAGAPARAVLACLTASLLLVALAGPSVRAAREGVCPVVLAHDISPSMSAAAGKNDPGEALAPWSAALPVGQVRLHPVAGHAGTDLERGITDAARTLPDGQGIVLLYTDARETRGDAVAAATRLAAAGIQVHAVVPDLRPRDVAILSLAPAGDAVPGRPVGLQVQLASTAPADAQVTVTRPAVGQTPERTWQRRVTVDPSAGAVLRFEDTPLPSGLYRYDARVRAPGDACAGNDRAACTVRVGRPQEILYVHGSDGPAPLADVLAANAPAEASLRTAPAASGIDLSGASVVVLDNVSAWTLGTRACRALARRVTDGGLGLLVLGGDAAFAAGGYADSPLEDLLPVSSRTGERPPLDIVLVVDASGSMNETYENTRKLALAKQAVLALRAALGQGDRIGIVAFAGEARVVSPLTPLARWDDLRARLVAIEAGGGTRITPAVEAAAGLFGPPVEDDTTVRHVMLLSDGRSDDFDVDRLIRLCHDRRASASAVATGPDAPRDRLGRLAGETGGRLSAGGDLGRLAETFLTDMAFARGEGLHRLIRAAVWVRPEPIWSARGKALPP
ncbi:MAG TPA: vWA domain-containing protein, partial [Phycisphaerae bacterium]|nr:vWA domain-containing protein [Phycisphaerae bacterium]